ncbi:hypothetical protein TWF481_007774 [Arthrobotrys musiformis]|uniref:Fatty acid hydroxylase domain-containing protein n=1 Tax=Arthrobotrys musiformis TaxID=47236 RepID=A0AAV9WD98_9PEZI
MDLFLDFLDTIILDSLYELFRSHIELSTCPALGHDESLEKHPKFARNQIRREISDSLHALFYMNIMTTPIFVIQINSGTYCKLYNFGTARLWYEFAQIPLFILFSDTCVYWLHRLFHKNSFLFKKMHKKHHNREQAHTVHHKNMNFNFGQFSSLWDRLAGTYVDPAVFLRVESARGPPGSKILL